MVEEFIKHKQSQEEMHLKVFKLLRTNQEQITQLFCNKLVKERIIQILFMVLIEFSLVDCQYQGHLVISRQKEKNLVEIPMLSLLRQILKNLILMTKWIFFCWDVSVSFIFNLCFVLGDGIFDKISNAEVLKQSWIISKKHF